jgi:uncharacterized protein YeaO (DUF488 family)
MLFIMIRTRRWNDPPQKGDGTRILICRYRPRGLKKADETWDEWVADLGPSRELLADYHDEKLTWAQYRARYLKEMAGARPDFFVRALRQRAASGEGITLLCSSACTDETHCHRTLLKSLIENDR